MTKLRFLAFILALVSMLFISSCGDDSSEESASSVSSSYDTKESETESAIDSPVSQDEESSESPISLPFIPFE